jgi:AraC family transcriptional regulator
MRPGVFEEKAGPGAPGFESLAQVYASGRYAGFVRSFRRHAGAHEVAVVRFAQPAGEFPDPPTPDYTLAVNESGSGEMTFDIGAGRQSLRFRRGDLVLKPPGVATRFANTGPHQKSFVSLPAALVARIAERDTGALAPLHAGAFRSAAAARLLGLLWDDTAAGSPEGPLFAESVAGALVATLFALADPSARAGDTDLALTAQRLRRVTDWVEAHLQEAFGVSDMAGVVGLSPSHFSRAFRRATGTTPHLFVTLRRVERAREMLTATELPLSEVALLAGFADQSHLTAVFRRHAGVTPGAYRRLASPFA